MNWHLIIPEYPPQSGGVSDYSHLVAMGLADAGETVHVWCPSVDGEGQGAKSEGVTVHVEFGRFAPADLRRVGRMLDQFPSPRRLLIQWVPHGYGYQSLNLPFCLWLWHRAKLKHDQLEIMVHEPFLAFGEGSWKQDIAAAVHRLMIVVLMKAASQVWVSIPDWEKQLRPFVFGRNTSFGWLPVPSNIPVIEDPEGIAKVRAQYASRDTSLVCHFGAYDHYMTELMLELLPQLLNGQDKLSVMLLGKGSLELRDRLIERHPEISRHIRGTGAISSEDISRHISACDVMLEPYEDGVSGRRGSVMAALSHGIPVVTTTGRATESCWAESGAVKLAKIGDIDGMVEATQDLLANENTRTAMSSLAIELYRKRFDIRNTISTLRGSDLEGSLARSLAVSS